eukprot:5936398-Amphidinium_carterae.1
MIKVVRVTSVALLLVQAEPETKRGVVFIGHVPKGFQEDQMKSFCAQPLEDTSSSLKAVPPTSPSRVRFFLSCSQDKCLSLQLRVIWIRALSLTHRRVPIRSKDERNVSLQVLHSVWRGHPYPDGALQENVWLQGFPGMIPLHCSPDPSKEHLVCPQLHCTLARIFMERPCYAEELADLYDIHNF